MIDRMFKIALGLTALAAAASAQQLSVKWGELTVSDFVEVVKQA